MKNRNEEIKKYYWELYSLTDIDKLKYAHIRSALDVILNGINILDQRIIEDKAFAEMMLFVNK